MTEQTWAIVVELGVLAVVIWGVVDAVRRPAQQWDAIGQRKIVWVLVQVVFLFVGVVLYLSMVRWRLKRVAGQSENGDDDRPLLSA